MSCCGKCTKLNPVVSEWDRIVDEVESELRLMHDEIATPHDDMVEAALLGLLDLVKLLRLELRRGTFVRD